MKGCYDVRGSPSLFSFIQNLYISETSTNSQ